MKKLLKEVLFLAAGMMLCFTSCSNGSDDPAVPNPNVNSNGSGVITASAGLKFDFSGAKALAAVDAGALTQGAGEESSADSPLIKFLEDGSAVAAVTQTGSGNLSKIKKIYKSPVASSKDVFVVFESQSWFNDNGKSYSLGTLVCVHEDGTVADILKKKETSNNGNNYYWLSNYNNEELVKFDASGNAYFIVSDNSGVLIICKFNPIDNSMAQLTAGVSGTTYRKFLITSDGQLILVSGSRWNNTSSTNFLRAIPISDPDNFTNLYYSSNEGGEINWVYDDQKGICYFSNYEQDGLSRSLRDGNRFSAAENIGSNLWWEIPIEQNSNNNSGYVWKSKFLKSDGTVNAKAVLQYMFKRCWTSGEKEFRLSYFENRYENNTDYSSLYSPLTDEAAVNWISENQSRMELFYRYFSWEVGCRNNIGYANGLEKFIFKKASVNETAYRTISDAEQIINHYWSNTDFYFSNSEGLWKNYSYNNNGNNAFYIVHVADSNGQPIWEASKKDLPSGKMASSQVYNNIIYMSYSLLTANGSETGFQQIYSVNLDTGAYKNLFQNVPNNSMLEVISYSVGSDLLYYSAVRGTAVENGVVNVTSGEYNPLTIKKKLTAIYTF